MLRRTDLQSRLGLFIYLGSLLKLQVSTFRLVANHFSPLSFEFSINGGSISVVFINLLHQRAGHFFPQNLDSLLLQLCFSLPEFGLVLLENFSPHSFQPTSVIDLPQNFVDQSEQIKREIYVEQREVLLAEHEPDLRFGDEVCKQEHEVKRK
jgi:hypothetical protein